jgi:hypothetical protein
MPQTPTEVDSQPHNNITKEQQALYFLFQIYYRDTIWQPYNATGVALNFEKLFK